MEVSKSSVLVTIVGFVYLLAIFFLFFLLLGISDLNSDTLFLSYAPYIVVVVIPLSFLLGLTVNLLINETIVPYFRKSNAGSGDNQKLDFYLLQYASKPLLDKVQSHIGLFYASRILILGFLALGISSSLWIVKSGKNYLPENIIVFVSLSLIALFIYSRMKKNVGKIREDVVSFLRTESDK